MLSSTSRMMIQLLIIAPIFLLMTEYSSSASAPVHTFNSYVIANGTNSTWLSPSGEFAFGFRRVAPGGYLLAIWIDGVPDKTIVWSANRDVLAPEGSRIQIFPDGRFGLDDPNGRQIWAANAAGPVFFAAMLDTGNFVLSGNSSNTLWESFDEPTDTLLPSQIFRQGSTLVSSFSTTNYSRGRFMLMLQDDGDLVLSTRSLTISSAVIKYWSTNTSRTISQLIFNQSGQIYLADDSQASLGSLFTNHNATIGFYQRMVLGHDGVLIYYTHPKHGNSSKISWDYGVSDSVLPNNICDRVQESTLSGNGACGVNSICSYGSDRRPICNCARNYSWVNSNDTLGGCVADFALQRCDRNESRNFDIITLLHTNFYYGDVATTSGSTEECRSSCLDDCNCAAVVQDGDTCWKKKFPLVYGRSHPDLGAMTMLKIRISNATVRSARLGTGNGNRVSVILSWILFCSSLAVNLVLISSLLFVSRRKSSKNKNGIGYKGFSLRCFSFRELEDATNGFMEELGRGAFSIVYKGVLDYENGGKLVAVKKLKKVELEKEFLSEIMSISKTNHRNLVQLIGFCDEDQSRLLVYEFMSNGSLAELLFSSDSSSSRPNWDTRVQIALDTARGLLYLHEECSFQIIHCDIKPQNVLLDSFNVAKIADFGLAKLLMPDQTRTTTMARGTKGYMAPEWFRRGRITAKVDVYSFGTMLLELVCCRKKYEEGVDATEDEVILAESAYEHCEQGLLHLLAMEDDGSKDDIERFRKFVMIALWCMQEDPSMRPNMKMVVNMLEGSVQVPLPPGVSKA